MKKSWIPLVAILGVIALVALWAIGVNNTLVQAEEGVNAQWSQVQSVYQRRFDLFQNLVNTVKGYATHEATTLEKVTEARSKVGQVNLNNPETLQAFEKSQTEFKGTLSRLLVVAEQYPELKAAQGFRDLQSQIEGTENRITIERQRFNEVARDYNIVIRRFPSSLVASFRGFQPKAYFQSAEGAEKAPKVEF